MNFKQRCYTNLDMNINYQGTRVNEVNSIKFLGLTIDNKLNWKFHVDNVCSRLHQFAYALFKLSRVTNEPAVLTAYHGHVASILRYGIIFWGNSTEKLRVFRAQKRCVRAICSLHKRDSCKEHFKELKILTTAALYISEIAVFVKANPELFQWFAVGSRLEGKCRNVSCRTKCLRKSVFCMAPIIFNRVPPSVRALPNLSAFKRKLNDLLTKKAYYTIEEFLSDSIII